MYKCQSIEKVESVASTDVLKVSLVSEESAVEAFWFYDYADAIKYVDCDVIVEFRKEMYHGDLVDVINTFTIPTQINTLDKTDNIKLYSNAEDNFATISFNDIEIDDELPNAIVYCISQEVKSSQKATWLSLLVRDKMFHVATLRLFAYDRDYDYTGHYIYVTPLVKTQYGLQTEQIKEVDGDVPENPEITIAKDYILNFFSGKLHVLQNMSNCKLFENLENIVDYEKGYKIVRIATELALTENLVNITNSIDIEAIQEAIIADALADTQQNSILSHTVKACLIASKCTWCDKKKVIQIIDISEEPPVERDIYASVKKYADLVIKSKKEVV